MSSSSFASPAVHLYMLKENSADGARIASATADASDSSISSANPDKYTQLFQLHSSTFHHFRIIDPLLIQPLHTALEVFTSTTADRYSGLIVTSKTTLQCIQSVVAGINPEWLSKPLYVLTPNIAALARSIGFTHVLHPPPFSTATATTSLQLAEYIVQQHEQRQNSSNTTTLPLLFPCSSIRRAELPTYLAQHGAALEELPIYATASNDSAVRQLIDELKALLETLSTVIQLVVFSPSGIDALFKNSEALPLIQRYQQQQQQERTESNTASIQLIAIGNTTATELKQRYSLTVNATAAKPTPEALLTACQSQLPS